MVEEEHEITVAELISLLSSLPQDKKVWVLTEAGCVTEVITNLNRVDDRGVWLNTTGC